METIELDLMREIFRTCPIGVMVIDENHLVTHINNYGAELFEFLPEGMIGTNLNDYVMNNPNHAKTALQFVNGEMDLDRSMKHVTTYGKAKSGRLVQLSIKIRHLSNGMAYAVFHDPVVYSTGDSLTNALTRDQFFIELNKIDTEFSLLFIDLNKFKAVNDTHGHIAGDFVLKTAAKRIQNILRSTDLFCRYGGDEFVIVIPGTGSGVDIVKAKIKELIGQPIKTRNETVKISCSIGMVNSTEATSVGGLINIADQRMYKEKEKEKNNENTFTK